MATNGAPSGAPSCVGCINPRALAEALISRPIDWDDKESTKLMCDILQTPYHELFDMKYNSPLYAGLKMQGGRVVRLPREQIKILEQHERVTPDVAGIKKLDDLKDVEGIENVGNIVVEAAALDKGKLVMTLNVPALNTTLTNSSMTQQMYDICLGHAPTTTTKKNITSNKGDQGAAVSAGPWVPAGGFWRDTGGSFFKDASEFSDPIQGSLGDCWLIAAMSAVAWAVPGTFVQKTRPIGTHEMEGVPADIGTNQITLYNKSTGRTAPTKEVEVTNKICVSSLGRSLFASSSDAGEIWPTVYEKAFAKWSTQDWTDFPDVGSLSGGDPVAAMAQITNRNPTYYINSSKTVDEIYSLVNANCVGQRTVNPMTAWTFGSSDNIKPLRYETANLAANHAYTLLGCTNQGGTKYVVLRNPWGYYEPPVAGVLNAFTGVILFLESTFWRPISLLNPDGVFAIEVKDFKSYFEGFGVATL